MMRNMERKIVAGIMCGLIGSFSMQAMIIKNSQHAQIGAGAIATVASLLVMSQSSDPQQHLGAILGTGVAFGGISYLGLREYTPDRIQQVANNTIEEMQGTNLLTVVFTECDDDVDFSKKVMRAYGGLDFFENSSKDINKYKPLLRYHLSQFTKANLNTTHLQMYYDRLEKIGSALPQCKSEMADLLEMQEKITKNKKTQSKIQNAEREVHIKNQEMNIKWWGTYLNIAKWSYPKLITSGLALCFFAWTLKLPYPSFSRG